MVTSFFRVQGSGLARLRRVQGLPASGGIRDQSLKTLPYPLLAYAFCFFFTINPIFFLYLISHPGKIGFAPVK
jgi:hypothetical protein